MAANVCAAVGGCDADRHINTADAYKRCQMPNDFGHGALEMKLVPRRPMADETNGQRKAFRVHVVCCRLGWNKTERWVWGRMASTPRTISLSDHQE